MKKWLIITLLVIITFSSVSAYNTTKTNDGRMQCEVDGTCCSSLTYEIGNICWTNISWSDCSGGTYCSEAHYNYDADGETWPELHQLHSYAADWKLPNPDDMANLKGGIFNRPRFRSYGINIVNGLTDGGGEFWDVYCDAFSCKSNSDGLIIIAIVGIMAAINVIGGCV